MIAVHPYTRYAQALIMLEYKLTDCEEITSEHLISEINNGLHTFRMSPAKVFEGKTSVVYEYGKIEKGDTSRGVFLAPNIISTDKQANNTWKAAVGLLEDFNSKQITANADLTMSVSPTSGEYLSFSLNGGIGRGKPKSTLLEQSLSAVTTLTSLKPCFQYRIDKKGMPEIFNVCLIPDLPIREMMDFISFFKKMLYHHTDNGLMIGNVVVKETGKGANKKITYSPKRPLIYKGNFPNPPHSSAMGCIAILGAIGEFTKEAEYSEQATRVLESLKNTEIYLMKYGGATTFKYNHHVIDIAKESKLKTIVDSMYYSQLYRGKRFANEKDFDSNTEYQKFDLFTSRFLQLFNHAAFKDFLAFRAEYPNPVEILFTTYYTKMEKAIDSKIVSSAKILGRWLNQVAFFAAKSELKEGETNYWDKLRKEKAKGLVEFESSIFSSKTGDALIAQTLIRAGRMSKYDAPEEASLFIEKTMSGEISLNSAKNLLIAFSRLKNKSDENVQEENGIEDDNEDDFYNQNEEISYE